MNLLSLPCENSLRTFFEEHPETRDGDFQQKKCLEIAARIFANSVIPLNFTLSEGINRIFESEDVSPNLQTDLQKKILIRNKICRALTSYETISSI